MELLKEFREEDVGNKEIGGDDLILREAVRAVLFDKDKIALLYVSKHGYHKLPGGVEKGEDFQKALEREALEETGCKIDIGEEIGIIIENRNKIKRLQKSYCYFANVKENTGRLELTENEESQGFQLVWVNLDEAIRLIENEKPDNYEGKFIQKRDYTFLVRARGMLKERTL